MPTYEYKREDGTTFEVWQGINDEPLETCPDTGQKVKRLISGGGGVVYKGDGFYITDYKKNKEANSGSTASSQGKDNSSKQENSGGTSTSDSDTGSSESRGKEDTSTGS